MRASGSLGESIDTIFGVIKADGIGEPTSVIEVANIFGLPMVPLEKRNPMNTTSRGLGEVIVEALDRGFRRFIIGLGGSSTNDGSLGEGAENLTPHFAGCFSIVRGPSSLHECLEDAESLFFDCTRNIARLLHRASRIMNITPPGGEEIEDCIRKRSLRL